MSIHAYLVLVLLFNHAEGQFSFSSLTKGFFENPLIQLATHTSSEALANTLNVLSTVPKAVASMVGLDLILSVENQYNVAEVPANFTEDYRNGLTNEDVTLSSADLILKYGFPLEFHTVETEDDYIITMYRIPSNGSAVFLMHGLLGSADDFVIAGPESGLAYLLAREGYDVWIGNARGNKHSRQHKFLNPSQKEFWNFSWHEIGVYDLPAMIDCVLEESKKDTLKYIGYSQGTTSFYVMASERPEYNDKISVMVALSPVAFMSNMKSPLIRLMVPTSLFIDSVFRTLGAFEFLSNNLLVQSLKKFACRYGPVAGILCSNVIFLLVGFDIGQVNATNLPVILGHLPSGGSTKQLSHYSQGIVSGEFAKYDYGSYENEKVYGTSAPPKYNLRRVTAPVALFYSENDWVADVKDVNKLSQELLNVVEAYKVHHVRFNHLDFIASKDFKTLIYNKLQYILKLY